MATNTTFNSAEFKWVLGFDPKKNSIRWNKAENFVSSIHSISQSVLTTVPTLTSHQDQQSVREFQHQLITLNAYIGSKTGQTPFNDSIEALDITTTLFKRSLSPRVNALLKNKDLNALLRGEGEKQVHLKAFLKAFYSVLKTENLSKKDLMTLQKLARKCRSLSSDSQDREIESLMGKVFNQFKYHFYIQSPLYQTVLNYKKGMFSKRDPHVVENEMTNLAAQLALFVQNEDYPIDDGEFLRIYENSKIIHKECQLLAPTFEKMREGFAKRFQVGLKNLDLDSPTLMKDVDILKHYLRELYPKNDPELKRLESYLNALIQPNAWKPSESEEKLIMWIKTQYPELEKSDYEPHIARSLRVARETFLSTMQENADSLESLCSLTQKLMPILKRQTMKDRFSQFLEEHSIEKPYLVNRFPTLVDYFDRFTLDIATKTCSEKWDAIKEVYDQKTDGRFSELSSQIGRIDMGMTITNKLIPEAQSELLKHLRIDELNNESEEGFRAELMGAISDMQLKLPDIFDNYYEQRYKKRHLWIVQNNKYLEVAFDQGLDIHKNLGTGTCFQNALNRQALLLKDPSLPGDTIPLGSSQKDRFHTAKIKMTKILTKPLGVEPEEALQFARTEQFKTPSAYELEEKHVEVLSEAGPPSNEVTDALVLWAQDHQETQFVITFQSPAHAFNIQIDEKRGLYRFMDDNVGLTRSYPDLQTFKTSLTKYLKAFYPEARDIKIRTYRLNISHPLME